MKQWVTKAMMEEKKTVKILFSWKALFPWISLSLLYQAITKGCVSVPSTCSQLSGQYRKKNTPQFISRFSPIYLNINISISCCVLGQEPDWALLLCMKLFTLLVLRGLLATLGKCSENLLYLLPWLWTWNRPPSVYFVCLCLQTLQPLHFMNL